MSEKYASIILSTYILIAVATYFIVGACFYIYDDTSFRKAQAIAFLCMMIEAIVIGVIINWCFHD